jgi:hypothetical protein
MRGLRYLLLCALALPAAAQRIAGEIRLEVADPAGLPLPARIELIGRVTQLHRILETDTEGAAIIAGIPLGAYELSVAHPNFRRHTRTVEVRTELPLRVQVTLELAGAATTVVIRETPTLLDPRATGPIAYIGSEAIRTRRTTLPSRSVVELVESQPGWLLEANGVLHPRGSEYNVQYVVDGTPLTDNRSPAFAPPLEAEDLEYIRILTGNYPAEFGRKLGGVVEAVRERPTNPGAHGRVAVQTGSFDTASAYASLSVKRGATSVSLSADAARTDRYLDPPVVENYSNRGSLAGLLARVEREVDDRNRVRALWSRRSTAFLVPNELTQQEAGQRQDRASRETMLQGGWERVISPAALLNIRGTFRDLDAELWSNALATPVLAEQDRGFQEVWSQASLAVHSGAHDWKAGGEFITARVRERFAYRVTDPEQIDDDIAAEFAFAGRRRSRESAAYVQDVIRLRNWTFSAGLRWDRYRFLVDDSAVSPRLGMAWHWPAAQLVLRASYDRAFEVPATENLLVSSSAAAQQLAPHTTGLPVPPSRGNFWQAGFGKVLPGQFRLEAVWFRRGTRNFADDALLLNTGLSFPVAFARARVHGFETKLELPKLGRSSGFLSWTNLSGFGELPITGGLFLEDGAELLASGRRFPITQDQRNTVQSRFRYDLSRRLWVAAGLRYGSGLPVEIEGEFGPERHDPRVLARVNLEGGRVRPAWSFDAAAGIDFPLREFGSLRLQFDAINITDQLNVINFAGLFSGTALAAPRSWAVRLAWSD